MSNLNHRLSLVASFVRHHSVVADIGTDHGFLPIHLIENGICTKVFACDINIGPLNSAKENIANAGLEDKINTVLCDGLSGLQKNDADDIVICGMGGMLIINILSSCSWLKSKNKRFILQPQRDADKVRKFMFENGFDLLYERAVYDKGHIYTVMVWEYDGVYRSCDNYRCLVGRLDKDPDDAEKEYLRKISYTILNRINGLKASSRDSTLLSELNNLYDKINQLL